MLKNAESSALAENRPIRISGGMGAIEDLSMFSKLVLVSLRGQAEAVSSHIEIASHPLGARNDMQCRASQ